MNALTGSDSTSRTPTKNWSSLLDIGLILVPVILGSFLVNPFSDFPIDDDWSYGRTVKHLLETGDFRPLQFTPAPMLTNILWGGLFCLLNGFSFTALRVSTFAAAVIGLCGLYVLVREQRGPPWLAILVCLMLGLNPIYFELTHTFDTDVLFIALCVWSAVFFSRALRHHSDFYQFIGTVVAFAATFSRELALCIPVAFGISSLLGHRISARTLLRSAYPLLVCAVAFFAFRNWLFNSSRLPSLLDAKTSELLLAFQAPWTFLETVLSNAFVISVYMGLFLSPVLLICVFELARGKTWRASLLSQPKVAVGSAIVGLALLVCGAALRASYGGVSYDSAVSQGKAVVLPITGWYIQKSGLGPPSLPDMWVHPAPELPRMLWITLTMIAVLGALALLAGVITYTRRTVTELRHAETNDVPDRVRLFLTFASLFYLLPLFLATVFDDRYLIPSVPLIAVVLISGSTSVSRSILGTTTLRVIAGSMIVASGFGAICGTHDYLEFNRVRWTTLRNLMRDQHVSYAEIDGGWEFNGFYQYNPNFRGPPIDPFHPERTKDFWVKNDTYRIAFGGLPGYRIIETNTYSHWLPPYRQELVLLRRE